MDAMTSLRVILLCYVTSTSSTYISWKSTESDYSRKSNSISSTKRHGPPFKADWDVARYLKLWGQEMMLWRCKNAIQPYWEWKPLPVVELYCEAIGRLKAVHWYHNGNDLEIGGRHGQLIVPHHANNRYFAKWIDFRLKIYNATMEDSGVYTFKAIGAKGHVEEQDIYVDISEKKKKKRNHHKHRSFESRNRDYESRKRLRHKARTRARNRINNINKHKKKRKRNIKN